MYGLVNVVILSLVTRVLLSPAISKVILVRKFVARISTVLVVIVGASVSILVAIKKLVLNVVVTKGIFVSVTCPVFVFVCRIVLTPTRMFVSITERFVVKIFVIATVLVVMMLL